ncbi:receptor-transporting protein 3-like [Scomber japonicus]|uniref:receptor-transporting protein 3-like n=1 Tax=Scomber japonicus TaxID=13676 RepID=UPI00230505A9|nr:receptor-transporting protein 3-like [Scomber japonicus]
MAPPEWTRIFQNEAKDLEQGDIWCLEFDYSIEPENPEQGWKEYIRNTSAWFTCTQCRRRWPSNQVKVFFHMRLMDRQGLVKMRPLRQNCKRCDNAPMEEPSITSDNIVILLKNLVKKIRIKCYNEKPENDNRYFQSYEVKSPHEPKHCEGCIKGVCTREFPQSAPTFF